MQNLKVVTALSDSLQKMIQRTFDIREGEFKISLLLQAGIFLIVATLLIVKPIVNALFINRFGVESLPHAYVILGVVAVIGSLLYSMALDKLKLITVILRTLVFSAVALIVFGVLLLKGITVGWVIYLFYIWTSIFAVLAASQFWILANIVFNVREAKRIFSFIGIGAISGGIVGGYLTSILLPITGAKPLLFIAALFLIICIPINQTVWRESAAKYGKFKRTKRMSFFSDNPLKSIIKSKLLTYLAAILGMSVLVAKLIDFQFSDIAAKNIPDPDELAQFFAFWLSNLNLVSLFVQLLITRWIVGKYGVGTSLLVLPIGVALGAIVTFAFPELWAVILLKSVDGSLKQSVNKSGVELLSLPIPFEIKNKTKTYIDVVVDSIATGIAGFILIFIINGLELGSEVVSAVIFVLVGIWIWLVIKVRKEYIKSFQLLTFGKIVDKSESKEVKPNSVLDSLEKIVNSGKESQIIYLLDQVNQLKDTNYLKFLLPLISHKNAVIVSKALHNLRFSKQSLIPELTILELIKSEHQEIRIAAFMYLLKHGKEEKIKLIEVYSNTDDPYLSLSALLAFVKISQSSFTLRSREFIRKKIAEKELMLELNNDSKLQEFLQIEILKIRSELGEIEDLKAIQTALKNSNDLIVEEAIKAAASTLNSLFIKNLIELLADKKYRKEVKFALYNFGLPMIAELGLRVANNEIHTESLKFIPSVLELFNSQKAVAELFVLLDHNDLAVRLEAIRSLNKVQINFPELNIKRRDVVEKINAESKIYLQTLNMMHTQLLVGFKKNEIAQSQNSELAEARRSLMILLESRMESHLERIFGLLGLSYPPEEMNKAYEAIQGEETDMRINAIEYLDNLLDGDLKRILIPIVEVTGMDSISEDVLRDMNLKVMREFECFSLILKRNDAKLKLAVIYLIGLLKNPQYKSILEELKTDPNEKIRHFARIAQS